LRQRRVPTSADISAGLSLLIIGLVKKIVIADTMAIQSTTMFSATAAGATPSMLEAWLGALCYTLQIYFDFSAYSDMAVGLARMFAIDFPINFASPYKARSIAEFWRRWHISLSRFLRDYLYIPLGGNRVGITRQQANLLIVMVIGGFWHGAAWTFIAWGALHGLYLLIHRWWQSQSLAAWLGRTAWWRYPACALTFLAVLVAWVPFRADDMTVATKIWASLFGLNGLALDAGRVQWDIATAALALLPLIFLAPSSYEIMAGARLGLPTHGYPATYISRAPVHWRPSPRWAAALACGSLLILLKINDVSEFIYFQF
jgi:alginate O-acetyltransferase complex protein AlgI